MIEKVIFSSEHILLTKKDNEYYIESFKTGMSWDSLNAILAKHVELQITDFNALKTALVHAPKLAVKFAVEREKIDIEVVDNDLRAYLTLCVQEEELTGLNKANLIKDIMRKLAEKGVVFGVKHEVIVNSLANNKRTLIAEGALPQNGKDSEITMYELKEAKPVIKEDGNADHYELNLINRVKAGEWLGERTDPGDGIDGKTVKGAILSASKGRVLPLQYDAKTVREEYKDGKTMLYAIQSGAVNYNGDKVSISNHLEVPENVDFKTGNIDFNGFLTIKGTVEDNFSIAASSDIEILGDYGVGSIREIMSREGSVYVKGGIAGKNKAVVKSKRDIYTKFVSDATVICEGSVHIGFYCLNSNIVAKEVILDSTRGQIIGGNIQAEIKVVASVFGSPVEKRTFIQIKGFIRSEMKAKYDELTQEIEKKKIVIAKMKQIIASYAGPMMEAPDKQAELERIKETWQQIKTENHEMEIERKTLGNYLKTHGEGEVVILKKAHPGTVFELKGILKEITKETLHTSFYVQNREIREL